MRFYLMDASHGYATVIAIIERTYVQLYILYRIRNWLPIEEYYYKLSLAFPKLCSANKIVQKWLQTCLGTDLGLPERKHMH